ncbi:MAG: hypothetical protein CSA35_00910 [Dethiosulfovibrio peptidovorans]|nr:MAG: hypothetical protein CSA35_00910 [Dethiosulfovibrio peptidovorans]
MTGDRLARTARHGAVFQTMLMGLGGFVALFGGEQIGWLPVVFLAAASIPWLAVTYALSRIDSGEVFSVDWRFSTAGLVAAVLGLFSLSALFGHFGGVPVSPLPSGALLFCSSLIPVGAWLAKGYFESILGDDQEGPLSPCLGYLRGSFLVGCLLVLEVLLVMLHRPDLVVWTERVALWLNISVAAEVILVSALEWFRPLESGEIRWFHRSRLLDLLSRRASLGHTLREAFAYQFGVDLSGSSFVHHLSHMMLPLGVAVILLLSALSSVVVVPQGSAGVILRWGRPLMVVQPGFRFKAPWPMDSTILVDVTRLRRVHVGSHRPTSEDGAVYKEGIPILWTNEHGLRSEFYLPVAPPADVAQVVAGERLPSVSFVGADVIVEYRIDDPLASLQWAADVVTLFRQLAERVTARAFAAFDVDTLVGPGREEVSRVIRTTLQNDPLCSRLGIAVEYVGIVGVHPPQPVAEYFEETVSALQERETAIQWARQAAVLRMTETVGDGAKAADLIRAIQSIDDGVISGNLVEIKQRIDGEILESGGSVAAVLSEAVGYRALREATEGARAGRFLSRHDLFSAVPLYYGQSLYLDVLDETLPKARKYVLPKEREDLVFRLSGLAPSVYLPTLDDETAGESQLQEE